MKKRVLALLLVVAMVAGIFSGCGKKGPVKINILRDQFNLAGGVDEAQLKKVQDAINEYIKDKIGVEVSIKEVGSGEYAEKAGNSVVN